MKGNFSFIVKYSVNGMTQYVVDGVEDSSSELHAKRFASRKDAEEEASALSAKGHGIRGVKVVKVGLRKGR